MQKLPVFQHFISFTFRAAGIVPPAEGEAHQCEHCKCHIPEKDIDVSIEPSIWKLNAKEIVCKPGPSCSKHC